MKKIFVSIALSSFLISVAVAQSADQNSKRINLGVGFVEDLTFIGGSFDYAVSDNIFLGANLYLHAKDQLYTLLPTVRGSYYFNSLLKLPKDNLDIYAGIGASKAILFYKGENESTDFYFPVHIGARYFFKEQLGIFAEFVPSNKVIDSNMFSIGIALKR